MGRVQMTMFCQPFAEFGVLFCDREKNFGIFRNTNDKKISRRRSIILDEVSWERGEGEGAAFFHKVLIDYCTFECRKIFTNNNISLK